MNRILILVTVFVVFFSCNNVGLSNNITQNFDSCILLIRSPYNCYYEITFNKAGLGNMKAFVNHQAQNNFKNDSLVSSYSFEMTVKSDVPKINKIIEEVKTSDTLYSPRMFDAYQFELAVDRKKYINVYGQNEKIDKLLKILLKYIKGTEDRCGFFKLYQKIPKNTQD